MWKSFSDGSHLIELHLDSADQRQVSVTSIISSLLLRHGMAAEYCHQPVCLSVREHISGTAPADPHEILCADLLRPWLGPSPAALLPVSRMTSRLAVMGATPTRVGSRQRRRSIRCVTGAESDVYESLFTTAALVN